MKRRSETQVTVWPAITDLMIAIVVIAVLAGIIGYSKYTEIKLTAGPSKIRNDILEEIDSLLKNSNLSVEVLKDESVLRLSDGIVNFELGEISPIEDHKKNVAILAEVLAQVVPCYISCPSQTITHVSTDSHSRDKSYCQTISCNETSNSQWLIGTVLIEGHTDTIRVIEGRNRFKDNLELSSMRAAEVYRMITAWEPSIGEMKNSQEVPIFSTSGYGSMRLAEPDMPSSDQNRRIDLRFLFERRQERNPTEESSLP